MDTATTFDWQTDHDNFLNAELKPLSEDLQPGDFVLPGACKGRRSDGTYFPKVNAWVLDTGPLRPLNEMMQNHVMFDLVATARNNGGGMKYYPVRPHTEQDDPTKLLAWIYMGR